MDLAATAGFFQSALAEGRLSHASLILGEDASFLAEQLAGLLLCREPENGRACGRCPECRRLAAGFHPDLMVVAPSPNSIKIDQIRELQRNASLAPYQAARKVFVVNEARKMTDEAANCLLKSLEEPVDEVFFILAADSGEGLLPTVLSRCQKFLLTAPARGEGDDLAEWLSGFMSAWGSRDLVALLKLGEGLAGDKLTAKRFLDRLALFFRDRLVQVETGPAGEDPWRAADLARCLTGVDMAARDLAANANTRLVLDGLFLRLAGEV